MHNKILEYYTIKSYNHFQQYITLAEQDLK